MQLKKGALEMLFIRIINADRIHTAIKMTMAERADASVDMIHTVRWSRQSVQMLVQTGFMREDDHDQRVDTMGFLFLYSGRGKARQGLPTGHVPTLTEWRGWD